MSSFIITDEVAGSQAIAGTSTTKNHPLGTIVRATDGATTAYGSGEFIYLSGVTGTVVGSFVTVHEDGMTTTLLAANDIGRVALAMSINIGSQYGWYQISGKGVGKVAASFADNGLVFATATAGTADDAVVAGDRVKQCIGASAIDTPSTGLAEMELDHPFMDDATSA